MILAIDTSTDYAGIALYKAGVGVIAEQTWLSGREQTTQLLPTLQRLMQLAGATTEEIIGIGVATGPGSFSGVRIGISTAKAMAYALQIPLYGVPTLDILAYSHAAVTAAQICSVLSMGRGRYAWALYRTRGAQWQKLTPYAAGTVEELCTTMQGYKTNVATLFCGEIVPDLAERLADTLGKEAAIAPLASSLRRAGYLAELAWQRATRGESDDPTTLQAIYLQPSAPAEASAK
ncbi:MAG: tRNA (adenosine(37)-N6)-threonylcarbamoyltransferase complex dimerization subunit type 1 TsaB [Chloroflexota bacterium]|nr:tRNA (adenosine(37)-N6)-threonylcarbamoyltransferase complex dimerization subunit type 1 TsaB [Chloroflexota bacterium]